MSTDDALIRRAEQRKKHSHCSYSTRLDGSISAGRGRLDGLGEWEFPCDECEERANYRFAEAQAKDARIAELEAKVRDLLAAVRAREWWQPDTAWRSMDEAPMDGTHVLLACDFGVCEGFWLEGADLWTRSGRCARRGSGLIAQSASTMPSRRRGAATAIAATATRHMGRSSRRCSPRPSTRRR